LKDIDKPEFRNILNSFEVASDKEFTELKAELYFETLKEFDLDIIRLACREIINTRELKSIPMPGEIRKEAAFVRRERQIKKEKPVYCKHCSCTGWITVENSNGYETAYRCDCHNGQKLPKENMTYKQAAVKYSLPFLDQPDDLDTRIVLYEEVFADPGKVFDNIRVEYVCKDCGKTYCVPYYGRVSGRTIIECHDGTKNFQRLIEEGHAEHLGGRGQCELCQIEEGRRRGFWE